MLQVAAATSAAAVAFPKLAAQLIMLSRRLTAIFFRYF